jgi:cytochrome bd ubiquinol oxidase subunit I
VTTELGRQPWIIYNVLKTADAVTPVTGLIVPFAVFTLLYFFLSIILMVVLRQIFLQSASTGENHVSSA